MDFENIRNKINKDALLQRASQLAHGSECQFTDDSIETNGVIILKIHFPKHGNTWAARIDLDQEWPFYEMSIQPLEFLARNFPEIPAPRVHDYVDAGSDAENPVGVAYVLIDWLDGNHLKPWSLTEPPVPVRHKVLDQIADLMLNMLSKNPAGSDIRFYSVPNGAPSNAPVTTTVWLTESIDRPIRRNLRQKKTSMVIDNLIQRSMVNQYVVSEHDNSPWAVVHPDIHNANIIVDEDSNITGLIDWNAMFAQPLQKWAVFPKLIEHVPGYAPPGLPKENTYLDFAQDKAYFAAILKEKELTRTGKTSISDLVQTSTERSFFEMSHNVATVHKEFAQRYCKRTKENADAAMRALESFLADNPGFNRSDAVVMEVEAELKALAGNAECGS